MTSIQQSFNQMLMSAQIGAGLYAHSPAGKQQAEIRSIKRNAPKIAKQVEYASENVSPTSSEATDKAYTEAFQKQVEQSKRLFELQPSKENFNEYEQMENALQEWEQALKVSQESRQATLDNQKKALSIRKQLLEGASEVPINRKKVEVDNNG